MGDPKLDANQNPVLERVNRYRRLAGLQPVEVDMRLVQAAQAHSGYQDTADQMTHYETDQANPFFSGHRPSDRIDAVKYDYTHAGEVIARQLSTHPANAVDALMTAIYHRFIILSNAVKHAGPGVTLQNRAGAEELYVTVDFAAEAMPPLPDPSTLTLYPADGHVGVPLDFDPAQEIPSPMPGQTLVGYPVSIQVDPRHALKVDQFELHEMTQDGRARGLEGKLLVHSVDEETPEYAAAFISAKPLAPGTTYRAIFSGSVGGTNVARTWHFTTAREQPVALHFARPTVAPGDRQTLTLVGLDLEKGPYHLCYSPADLVKALKYETQTQLDMVIAGGCSDSETCAVTFSASYVSSCANPFATGSFNIAR